MKSSELKTMNVRQIDDLILGLRRELVERLIGASASSQANKSMKRRALARAITIRAQKKAIGE